MKFCKYCGTQIDDASTVCPNCKKTLNSPKSSSLNSERKEETGTPPVKPSASPKISKKIGAIIGGAVLVVIILIVVIASGSGTCQAANCRNKPVSGSDYCYSHKCILSSCENQRNGYSNYCSLHYWLYDDNASTDTNYVSSTELEISGIKLSSKSNYTYAEGTITNNSDSTVKYVKIKGSFETSSGTVIDTDWTYAVGSEGLEPGESCKWKLSVSKDSSIKNCTVTILDFDY
jgi:hypothetical protein